jgi:hypothetical protein
MDAKTYNSDSIFSICVSGIEPAQCGVLLEYSGECECNLLECGFEVLTAGGFQRSVIKAPHFGIQKQRRLIEFRKRLLQIIPAPFGDVLENNLADTSPCLESGKSPDA